ncbi:hypothetical protein M1D93_13220 [Arthrobacter sp. Z1-9]
MGTNPSEPSSITIRRGRRPLMVAVRTLILLILLGGCSTQPASPSSDAAAGESSSSASAKPTPQLLAEACESAAILLKEHPDQALELIDKIRNDYAPGESSPRVECEDIRLQALTAIGNKQDQDNQSDPTAAERAKTLWDKHVESWISPWASLAIWWVGTVAGLLVLSRLLVFLPTSVMPPGKLPWKLKSRLLRRTALVAGLSLMLAASLGVLAYIAVAGGNSAGIQWILILLAVGGSALFAIGLATRQRISIDARKTDGDANEATTTRVVALMGELGSTSPHGLEVPRGSDATGLGEAAVTVGLTNTAWAALQKIAQAVFAVTPWHVAVDSQSDNIVSVVITRNGWHVAAASIDRADVRLFPVRLAAPAVVGGSKNDQGEMPQSAQQGPLSSRPAPPVDLHKMAAAFILATLAEHYEGYEGFCGATDWRSIGLHYLATTDYNGHRAEQRALLYRALNFDYKNNLAEVTLQNLLHRDSKDDKELEKYAESLLEKIKLANEETLPMASSDDDKVSPNAGPLAASARPLPGYRSLLYRLQLTYVSVALNLAALRRIGTAETTLAAKEQEKFLNAPWRIAQSLMTELRTSHKETRQLEQRLRPQVALAYYSLCRLHLPSSASQKPTNALPPGQSQENDQLREWNWPEDWVRWYTDAMASMAPAIAFNAACSIASQFAEDSDDLKKMAWGRIQKRLTAAAGDPQLAESATTDPEIGRFVRGDPLRQAWLRTLFAADTQTPKCAANNSGKKSIFRGKAECARNIAFLLNWRQVPVKHFSNLTG